MEVIPNDVTSSGGDVEVDIEGKLVLPIGPDIELDRLGGALIDVGPPVPFVG